MSVFHFMKESSRTLHEFPYYSPYTTLSARLAAFCASTERFTRMRPFEAWEAVLRLEIHRSAQLLIMGLNQCRITAVIIQLNLGVLLPPCELQMNCQKAVVPDLRSTSSLH